MKIYKYKLNPRFEDTIINLPSDSRILDIQTQNDEPVIWFLVDDHSFKKDFIIKGFITGQNVPIPLYKRYLKTIQFQDGFVIHYFID
jgi:hypothetical protein